MHFSEKIWCRFVVPNTDGIGKELRQKIQGGFIIFILNDLLGGGHVIAARWCFAWLLTKLETLAVRIRKCFQGNVSWLRKPPWMDSVVWLVHMNRSMPFCSGLCWLGCVCPTSTVACWLSLQARYVLVLLFDQPIHWYLLRQVSLLLVSYSLTLCV